MELSVGDKVRVYFYPPSTTCSFVEGIVDRSQVNTFWGPSFSLRATREVILGHETSTSRSLPYIIAYLKEDEFEGRIEVLEPAAAGATETAPDSEEDQVPQAEFDNAGEEPGPALETQVEVEAEPESQTRGWRWLFNRAA
jgi:hypothetical protein